MILVDNNNGFTLIEVLIAIVIITIASLGVASLTAGVIRGNSFSSRLTIATTLAQDRLEYVKRLGYDNAFSTTETYGSMSNYEEYKRVTTVYTDKPMSNMKTVTVEVCCNNGKPYIKLGLILAE